jgi:hypothetical protein
MILKLPVSRTSDTAARMRHRAAVSTELRRGVLLRAVLLPREGRLAFRRRLMKNKNAAVIGSQTGCRYHTLRETFAFAGAA